VHCCDACDLEVFRRALPLLEDPRDEIGDALLEHYTASPSCLAWMVSRLTMPRTLKHVGDE